MAIAIFALAVDDGTVTRRRQTVVFTRIGVTATRIIAVAALIALAIFGLKYAQAQQLATYVVEKGKPLIAVVE